MMPSPDEPVRGSALGRGRSATDPPVEERDRRGLTEETARTRRFPGIGFRGDDARRRAWVIGSGLDVWEIAQMSEDFGSVESLVSETHLTPAHARIALAYRDAYRDEIEAAIADNRRPVEDGYS